MSKETVTVIAMSSTIDMSADVSNIKVCSVFPAGTQTTPQLFLNDQNMLVIKQPNMLSRY